MFGSRVSSLELAQRHAFIQYNRPTKVKFLVFDIDREHQGRAARSVPRYAGTQERRYECADAWRDADLPPPNWTITNPRNGHAHLCYVLEKPVYFQYVSCQRPKRFVDAIRKAYSVALGADPNYVGHLAKNPLHPSWLTEPLRASAYSLEELAEYVDLRGISSLWVREKAREVGRNVALFDDLRKWAYQNVAALRDRRVAYDGFAAIVFEQAQVRNDFGAVSPLSNREVRGLAKSVAKWVWKNYVGVGSPTLELRARQSMLGAKKGAAKRTRGLEMIAAGALLPEIVKALNVDRATVYRWFNSFPTTG